MRTLLVFHGKGSHPLSFLLKKGFNHVFACVDDGTYWIRVERLAFGVEVDVICGSDYGLAQYYRNEGFTVVEKDYGRDKVFPFEAANCVGLVKSVTGIRSWCFTPYQLYKRIK